MRYLQAENKHKPLIEAYNLLDKYSYINNTREKFQYKLDIILYLIQVFTRAEDEENLIKYLRKYFEILNKISKDDQIVYSNRLLKMLKLLVKTNANSSSSGKFDHLCAKYLNKVEKFYSEFFELTPEILNEKLLDVNYIFSDFYYCAAHLLKNVNLDDSVLSMILANKIYEYKLGGLSENFKETNMFIASKIDRTNLNNLDGESN